MSRYKTMEAWILEAMADTNRSEAITAFGLVHCIGAAESEIYTLKLAGGQWEPKTIADFMLDKAQTTVQSLPGHHAFKVLAFYGKNQPEAFFPHYINVASTGENGLYTEAPTEDGRRQQRMRHDEMLGQQYIRGHAELHDFSCKLLGQASAVIHQMSIREEKLLNENHDAYEILREMMMQKATDEHTRRMEEQKFIRATEERKQWLRMAAPLVNTLTGKEIFPQSTEDSALIETIADNLDEEAIGKIAASGLLPPAVLGPLASRMQRYLAEKAAKVEAAQLAAASSTAMTLAEAADEAGGN